MREDEVFPNPTLESVHFEIRFPTLFYLDQKIGEFQMDIMERFPLATQLIEQKVTFGPDVPPQSEQKGNVWKFQDVDEATTVEIRRNRINIHSEEYKSYNIEGEEKFRDIIEYIVSRFLAHVPLPTMTRIGIRYIDHCPLDELDNDYFKNFYKPIICIDHFPLNDTIHQSANIRIQRENHVLTFNCGILQKDTGDRVYIMDFDAYTENISSSTYLSVTDELHSLVFNEYMNLITDDLIEYMRRG